MKTVGKNVMVSAPNSGPMTTPSGLYIAPSADSAQIISGRVEFVGPEVKEVSVGDRVHFNKFIASKVTINNTDYFVFPYEQTLAVE